MDVNPMYRSYHKFVKYLFFSDLHGSTEGLALLQGAVAREKPDVIVCLGDILYGAYDGDAEACANYLSSLSGKMLAVRGNCDWPYDEMRILTPLPEERTLHACGHRLFLRHVPFWKITEPGDALIYGHTHVKMLREEGGVFYMNPGSIGKPRDGSSSYAIIEDGRIALIDATTSEIIQSLPL